MAGTRWIRLDVAYFRNPKALEAGRDGRALHLASICWSGAELTDGRIPPSALPTVLHDAGVGRRAVDLVVDSGLWIPNGSGYVIHDYADMNPTRADVEADRQEWRERQRRYRMSRRDKGVT